MDSDDSQEKNLAEDEAVANSETNLSQVSAAMVGIEEEDNDESNEVLEAQTIFVLMSKQFRLSRNARAQW